MDKLTEDRPESEFYSTRDAAERLGVSIKTAQSWVETGVLQAWKTPGGHRRIHRDSVDALLRERAKTPRTPAQSKRGFTILAVDDDPQMLKLYELNIGYWGLPIRLLTAANGFQGLLNIGEEMPQLLITDLNMPGMDGFRMLRSIRTIRTYDAMHIVIVTGLSAAEIRDQGGLPDDIALFSKPVAFDRLKQRVESLVAARTRA
jgi:excisionase family DNA binding protein